MNGLGRVKLHDSRSRAYAYRRAEPVDGRSVRHRLAAPHVDQFYLSGCVGFAGVNALNTRHAHRSRGAYNRVVNPYRRWASYLGNNDGIRNYSESTRRDPFDWEYPPTNQGSSALGLMKWWLELGVIGGYEWAFSFDQFLAALQEQPVLVGTDWYAGMTLPDDDGVGHPTGRHQGGHEYLATVIRWPKQLIGYEQSWGEDTPYPSFYLTFDDAAGLLAAGGDAAVPRFL